MRVRNALVVHMSYHTKTHRQTLALVTQELSKRGIKFDSIHRLKLNSKLTKNRDLIIVVGGDGTFLRSSHFVKDKTPLFGVNSDPHDKEGFFLKTNKETFKTNLDKIIAGKAKLTKFSRAKAVINGKEAKELALNEFYIGELKGYRMSAYKISVGNKSERQKSSSVIVSTGAGSHAWINSAGGKIMSLDAPKLQYLVREAYAGKLTKNELVHGYLKKGESITIESEIVKGVVIADGVGTEHPFKKGHKVTISLSNKPLHAYWF